MEEKICNICKNKVPVRMTGPQKGTFHPHFDSKKGRMCPNGVKGTTK